MVVHLGQDVEVKDGLRRKAEHLVGAEQGAEQQCRVAPCRGAGHDESFDLLVGDQWAQSVRHTVEARAVARDAAVIPGLTQVAHEQPFHGQRGGEGEELKGWDADLPDQAAEGEQQRGGVACHVQAHGRVGVLEIPAEARSCEAPP